MTDKRVLLVTGASRGMGVNIATSSVGIAGMEFCSAYAATKFALEGWMESLTPEVAPYGIRTMLVEPGFFRTDALTPESVRFAEASIDDYRERTEQTVAAFSGQNGRQSGDPAKLGQALMQLVGSEQPPLRWPAGADAVDTLQQKAQSLLEQAAAYRQLSSSLAHEDTVRA